MFKKAQSAMEYLMTYGWAILIILIAVGALFYLGVFSPKTSSICQLSAPFVCDDVVINNNGILFLIKGGNMVGNANVEDIKINGESCSELNGFLYNTNVMEYAYTGCAVGLSENNKISGDISIDYTLQGGYSHDLDGEYSGSVEEGSIFNNIQQAGGIFHLDNQNLLFGWDGESYINYISGLVGTPQGGITIGGTQGQLGSGTEFDGVNDYIEIEQIIIPVGGSYTISLWVYIHQWDGYGAGAGLFNGPNTRHWNDYISLKLSKIYIEDNSGRGYTLTSSNNDLNEWHHVVIVFSNSEIKGYIDGVATTISIALSNPLTLDRIGDGYGSYSYLNGLMDEVHIWNRALSDIEIQNLYNSYI